MISQKKIVFVINSGMGPSEVLWDGGGGGEVRDTLRVRVRVVVAVAVAVLVRVEVWLWVRTVEGQGREVAKKGHRPQAPPPPVWQHLHVQRCGAASTCRADSYN